MATYYSSSNNQRDAAPIHYLRVPFANSYAESSAVLPSNMMMYADSGQQNSCAEIPIPSVGASDSTPPQQESLSNLGDSHIAEHNYGAWILNGSQGLSLSLSTQIPSGIQILPAQFRNPNSAFSSFENSLNKPSANGEFFPPGFAGVYQDSTKSDPSVYGMSGIAKDVPNSKYLRATQQLLDEVVNVHEALKPSDPEKKVCKEAASPSVSGGPSNPQESELSPAERQEFQSKLTKLLSMVDEVDRRYKQYYHQMQIVVSSFDVIAGYGAAKPYTALALQTISRHFRCLRDAITGQIQVTRKNLGEENISINSKGVGIARLRYVDKQLRQQRALQQLGMMQQHMWRPQRGLPETSVSVLRAWLFEHFLHPYPKDSDKIMLARQTGLTRSQVSNWFINARVRLWKPMVEEMYKEETGDVEMDSNSSAENASKPTRGEPQASEDRGQDVQQSTPSTATDGQFFHSSSDHIPNSEMSGSITGTTFLSATHQEAERPNVDYCSLYPDTTAYQISELGRFGNGGGVSLTLGLQHCDGPGLHGPGVAHHGLVAVRGDDVYSASASSAGPETVGFDCMDPGNQQQPRFSSSHILHDFVA